MNNTTRLKPLFHPGRLLVTPEALEKLRANHVQQRSRTQSVGHCAVGYRYRSAALAAERWRETRDRAAQWSPAYGLAVSIDLRTTNLSVYGRAQRTTARRRAGSNRTAVSHAQERRGLPLLSCLAFIVLMKPNMIAWLALAVLHHGDVDAGGSVQLGHHS
ncbi:hypothetical protein [Paraburkholderia caledonica]|uniref:Integrase n=1 Tax=Paraburkholderia caledonica TaxID=134536 RepID=A0AB73INN6_9BURK|nr:hypothetical protein [Paraburkholderia caledonica]